MKKIEKEKRISKGLLAIILSVALVLTVAAVIIIRYAIAPKGAGAAEKIPPVPLEGEGVANGSLMAYPLMEESKIQSIVIENDLGKFGMSRPDGGGNFILYYDDGKGGFTEFRPNICDVDDDFSYSSLYSVEMNDGFGGVTKLKYLCMALMYPYVEERIELIPEEKDAQLDAYGLAKGEYETVYFSYLDENGNEKSHEIQIGDKTSLETGYYLRVDGRDCVYASFQNQFDYALGDFFSFIKPLVISPGIPEDTVISAYLTTNYNQWKNEVHNKDGELVEPGSRVIVFADTIVPVDRSIKDFVQGGYINDKGKSIEFDLSKLKGKAEYQRLINALSGKAVSKENLPNEIAVTLVGGGTAIDFGEALGLRYDYSIVSIEAILTDDGEISAPGTPVGSNNLLKISYRLKISGEEASQNVLHAVVDLTDAELPESFKAALRAASVGELSEPINLCVDYSKANAHKQSVKYVITELVSVFNEKGIEIPAVTDKSIVTYRYRFMINGKYDDEEHLATLNLGADTSEAGAKIKAALKGKSPSRESLSIVADEYIEYCEYFKDFVTYSIKKVEYFVTKKIVSSFRFQNRSERDPFFGESIYENTIDEVAGDDNASKKYSIYGLNNAVCQRVVNILTGISEDSSSNPTGLSGTETVAVGLTPEIMEKYELYAYTVYFELPRGIYAVENEAEDVVDDYAWYEILGFTLHISEEFEDEITGAKYRFVASDLYDLVAKVDAEKFVFLKYDFVNFFARREMMLTDVAYMQEATFELCFENLKGVYRMYLNHEEVYWGNDGKRYEYEDDVPEGVGIESDFDEITVVVSPMGDCTPNKLVDYINKHTSSGLVSLTQLYNKHTGDGKNNVFLANDPLGTSNFKKLLENIYLTGYSGVISEGEQAKILASNAMVFRMSYKIESSADRYVYEFYRYDEGRVMVRLYQASYNDETNTYSAPTTAVSDFYISNFAFRKIVTNFVKLLNVEMIDQEVGYPE